MTKHGLERALIYGETLPAFSNLEEATIALFEFRDNRLSLLTKLATGQKFGMDYSPNSLKALEAWYFDLYEQNAFEPMGVDRAAFEECLAMYFGEVVVRNQADAKWVINEFAIRSGKFELGVNKGLGTMILKRFTDHFKEPNNKRRQSLYRRYQHFFDR